MTNIGACAHNEMGEGRKYFRDEKEQKETLNTLMYYTQGDN